MLEQALNYQRLGVSVIPLHSPKRLVDVWGKPIKEESRGKVPMCNWSAWQHKQASIEQIKQWWTSWPDANIGIITGKESNISIIDVDTEDRDLIDKLELPPTAIVKSGRGYHYWYKFPVGYGINTNINKPPGFEYIEIGIQSANRVAPPSIHHSGHVYEWLTGMPESLNELGDFPIELLDKIGVEKNKNTVAPGRINQITSINNVPDGQKHNAFMDLFTRIIRVSPTEEFNQVWENALLWNGIVCVPPMPVEDLRKRFNWIVDKEGKGRSNDVPELTDLDAPPIIRDEDKYYECLVEDITKTKQQKKEEANKEYLSEQNSLIKNLYDNI